MKKIIILAVILVLLVGGYFVLQRSDQQEEVEPPAELSFDAIKADNVSKILFGDVSMPIEIVWDVAWKVNDQIADEAKVSALVSRLAQMKVADRVSSNPDNHNRFEVGGNGQVVTVGLTDGKEFTFILGKPTQGGQVYLRAADQDEVYEASGINQTDFQQNLEYWLPPEPTEVELD